MTTTQYLDRPDGRLAYQVQGSPSGPLIICIPGMGDLRDEYRFLSGYLQEAGYRVACLDLRGHGESSTDFKDYSPEAVGSDIVALIKKLAKSPVTLIGTSMAAASAVWAAAEMPERVEKIVLIGPFVRDIPLNFAMRVLTKVMFLRPWGPVMWSTFYRSLYPSALPSDFARYQQRLRANLREAGRLEAFRTMLSASKGPCEARIGEVSCRTLIVMGTRDPDFKDPKAEAQLAAQRLSGELLMVEGAGHYPHAELPQVLAPGLLAFLKKESTPKG